MDKLNEPSSELDQVEEIEITPELIREIADKVYVLLLRRLQIERERTRLFEYED